MNRTRKTALATVGLAVVATTALSGCKSTPASSTPGAPTATTTTTTTASAAPKVTVSTTPLPKDPTWKGSPAGGLADVTWDANKCGKDKGKQTVTGTVTNSAKVARDYAIMIMWLKNDSGTPLGGNRVIVNDVKPGETKEWTLTANVADKADRCVPNVLAGDLK